MFFLKRVTKFSVGVLSDMMNASIFYGLLFVSVGDRIASLVPG